MPAIILTGFGGEQPRIAPRLLPPNAAQFASNVRLYDGALTPTRAMEQAGDVPSAGRAVIYKHGDEWLSWSSAHVRAAPGPVAADRLYYTGDGAPKMRTADGSVYPLAVPRPTAAPTLAKTGAPTDDAVVSRLYVYTFVTSFGEESEPCPAPSAIDWSAGETVTVSGIEAAPGGRGITKQRFYRTQTGREGTYLYLIAERTATSADFVDDIDPDVFQEPLPSAAWNAPPDDLAGLIALPNGMMAAFKGKDLYFSEPYRPHAWPEQYVLTADVNIVALAAIANTVVVLTDAQPYVVLGTHPSSMQMTKTEINLPCISPIGVADLGYAVLYPSHDGLVSISPDGGARIISGNLFQRDEWFDLDPASMIGCQFGGLYAGFYSKLNSDGSIGAGAIMIDASGATPSLTRQSVRADAAWFDARTGGTYVLPHGSTAIMRLDAPDAPRLSLYWKSKPFFHQQPVNYGVILVEAQDDLSGADRQRYEQELAAAQARNSAKLATGEIHGPLLSHSINGQTLAGDDLERPNRSAFTGQEGYSKAETVITADGRVVATLARTNTPIRLPSGFLARQWEVSVTANLRVEKITLATTMSDLQQSPPG